MYKIFLLLAMVIVTTPFFAFAQKKGFVISGVVTGFADSTMLFLEKVNTASPSFADSTRIINNQFRFSGLLKEHVGQYMIRTKQNDYKYLWVENSMMTFKAEKGKFRDAIITGSASQDDENRLAAAVKETGHEKAQEILFIQNHPNSIVSANILNVYASTWGKDTAAALYNKLSPQMKNSSYGKDVASFIALNKSPKIGDHYADFSEPDTNGKNVSLSDVTGKLVLLEFWGSWCGPCREGNPELVKTYNEFRDKGFSILGVAADGDKNEWLTAVQQDGLVWQNVCDFKGDKNKACLIYGISYYPSNFLIDSNGIIIARDLRGEVLKNKLQEILK